MDQEIGNLNKGTLVSQVFNGIASIAQDAFIAVQEGDTTGTGAGIFIAGIQGDISGFLEQSAYVDRLVTFVAGDNGQGVGLAFDGQGGVVAVF